MITGAIPIAALDDRLGFVGMTGSGKTFGAGTCVEHILRRKGRVIIPDPLGVWWGLRLCTDGKTPSPYDIVIFGGPHGDLPLTPHAGALVGEAVATMRESAIIDLSQFDTAASERRFMLAFLDALYRKSAGEPVHMIFDEADMWAPERIVDKEGDATKLHGMMQNVVRRGRIKGLTSWLISQRPAALSKNVLSQVDGLVAFRLTASQDRKALGLWIEGQADKEAGKAILGRLPEKRQGEAVVWLPQRGILDDVMFPPKVTYDSSRAPKRGETRRSIELQPLNLDALKGKLATVEAQVKANDPGALRAEIARLQSETIRLQKQVNETAISKPNPKVSEDTWNAAVETMRQGYIQICTKITDHLNEARRSLSEAIDAHDKMRAMSVPFKSGTPTRAHAPRVATPIARTTSVRKPVTAGNGAGRTPATDVISGPQRQLLQALAWWKAMGHDRPTRVQAATICGWRVTSGHIKNVASALRTAGLIDYPSEGALTLTEAGAQVAPAPDTSTTLIESVRAILSGPQRQVFDFLHTRNSEASRDQITEALGWESTSGHIKNVLSSMRSLEVVDYPQQGYAVLAEWIQSERDAR